MYFFIGLAYLVSLDVIHEMEHLVFGMMKIGNLGGTKNGTSSGLQSTKLVGTIRVTKKMSHIDNGSSPSQNDGETAILQMLHIFVSFLECKTAIFSNCSPNVNLLSITLNFFL